MPRQTFDAGIFLHFKYLFLVFFIGLALNMLGHKRIRERWFNGEVKQW